MKKSYAVCAQILTQVPGLDAIVGPDHPTAHHALLWAGCSLPPCYRRGGTPYTIVQIVNDRPVAPRSDEVSLSVWAQDHHLRLTTC